jgi:hypothetical protein
MTTTVRTPPPTDWSDAPPTAAPPNAGIAPSRSIAPSRPGSVGVRRRRRLVEPWALVGGLLTLIVVLVWLHNGIQGVDRAAHVYAVEQYRDHGWRMWDNYWYAGRYELVNYSVLYYPVAAWVGETVVTVVSLVGTSLVLGDTIIRRFGPRAVPAALVVAASWSTLPVTGELPFAFGVLFAAIALAIISAGHYRAALPAVIACLGASPLAFLLLVVVLAGIALSSPRLLLRGGARDLALGVLALGIVEALVLRVFPSGGRFPFPLLDLVGIVAFSGVGIWLTPRRSRLRHVYPVYGLVGAALYLTPSGVGGNVERLLDYFALALFAIAIAERPRALKPMALVGVMSVALAWQALPVIRNVQGGLSDRASNAAFWTGAVGWLNAHQDFDHRVEAVATWGHWESYYLARSDIMITRGWFRQDDFPVNGALYRGSLDASSYRAWLRSLGVRYVVLPNEQLDYSAEREAALLRTPGRAGLVERWSDANVTIFELPRATPLVTPTPATVLPKGARPPAVILYSRDALVVTLPGPGVYDLRVRYTPYWNSSNDAVCIAQSTAGNGMTRLFAAAGGVVRLSFSVSLDASAARAVGTASPRCAYQLPRDQRGD